jgi:GUN4-like/ARM-like repeat domain, GUN4-N terminal
MNLSPSNSTVSSDATSANGVSDLRDRLKAESEKTQLQLIQSLPQSGEAGLDILMEFLLERKGHPATPVDGCAYQTLRAANTPKVQEFLENYFPQGVVTLHSEKGIDYAPIQQLLIQQDFQTADRVTLEKMCELAGATAVQRKWLYFSEVDSFPIADLQTINTLWRTYSDGKFGFSVQRELWMGVGKNWDKLWPQIGWKNGNTWTRYPQEFVWDLSAPRGHLPLSNQLRGVRVMASLMAHPAWVSGA